MAMVEVVRCDEALPVDFLLCAIAVKARDGLNSDAIPGDSMTKITKHLTEFLIC